MKSIFIKIIIAFVTLLIGVGAFLCWNILPANQLQIEIPNELVNQPKTILSTCQLIDSPTEYNGKLITLEATAYVYDKKIILSPKSCSSSNYGMCCLSPELELAHFEGTFNNLNVLLEDQKEVDVVVTGKARTGLAEGFSEPIFIYYIAPTDIKLVSPIRDFVPKGAA